MLRMGPTVMEDNTVTGFYFVAKQAVEFPQVPILASLPIVSCVI